MIGNGAIRAAGRRRLSGSSFLAEAVYFDGTNDYLNRSSLTGVVDSKTGTFSCWVRPGNMAGNLRLLWFGASSNYFSVLQVNARSSYLFTLRNSAGGAIWQQDIGSSGTFQDDNWYHIMVSYNLATFTTHMYVDGVSNKGQLHNNILNQFVDLTHTSYYIGSQDDGTLKYNGEVSEMYWTDEYIDLSVQSNREKFIDSTGTGAAPVDLGSDGSSPTGTQPLLYMKGNASVWNAGTNAGSGGDFTMTGAVTDSSNEPVELP